jgi:hypothetical protein
VNDNIDPKNQLILKILTVVNKIIISTAADATPTKKYFTIFILNLEIRVFRDHYILQDTYDYWGLYGF